MGHQVDPPPHAKFFFNSVEIDTIFLLKTLNYTCKQMGELLKPSPDVAKNAYRHVNKKTELRQKENASKSTATGRLAGISKRIVWINSQISYQNIPGVVRAIISEDHVVQGFR